MKNHVMHGAAHADASAQRLHECLHRIGDINGRKPEISDAVADKKPSTMEYTPASAIDSTDGITNFKYFL